MDKSPIIEAWIAQGMAQGRLEARRANLLYALRRRCRRPVPRNLAATIEVMTDMDELDRWFVAALHVNTYAAFRAAIER